MKWFLVVLMVSGVAYADDFYRSMELTGITEECATSVGSGVNVDGLGSYLIEHIPKDKKLVFSYAMSEKFSSEKRQAIRDGIAAALTAACGKGYEKFETIQKGEKLTTAKDLKK